jgi:hypothetical protein
MGKRQPYRHASAAHKILAWPAIQELLFEALPANIGDLKILEQDGPVFITTSMAIEVSANTWHLRLWHP